MGSIGAFLSGDKNTIKFLKYNMRSQVFAKSMPMVQVLGNMKKIGDAHGKIQILKKSFGKNANSTSKWIKKCWI